MFSDPAIVHSVADLRREALLAEAAATSRATPGKVRRRPVVRLVRCLMAQIIAAISRVVDDFEPAAPTPRSQTEVQTIPTPSRTWTL